MMERRAAMVGRAIRAMSGRCEEDISRVNCIEDIKLKLTAALRDCESIVVDGWGAVWMLEQLLRRSRNELEVKMVRNSLQTV
jgi:hypothetical protein